MEERDRDGVSEGGDVLMHGGEGDGDAVGLGRGGDGLEAREERHAQARGEILARHALQVSAAVREEGAGEVEE